MTHFSSFRVWMVLAALLVVGATAASAQVGRPPVRVRVLAPSFVDSAFVATLTGGDAQGIVVAPAGERELRIPRGAVERLEVSRGRRSYRLPAMLVGALVSGTAAGLAAASTDCTYVCGPVVTYSALGGVLAGGGVGYLIGGQFHYGRERWQARRVD
ncbi:MAG TPA: hypothetical protein VF613_23785 [Longimicrobium sp.]|jgi:hypothetical protein